MSHVVLNCHFASCLFSFLSLFLRPSLFDVQIFRSPGILMYSGYFAFKSFYKCWTDLHHGLVGLEMSFQGGTINSKERGVQNIILSFLLRYLTSII